MIVTQLLQYPFRGETRSKQNSAARKPIHLLMSFLFGHIYLVNKEDNLTKLA